ncbi:hypothetical protein [Sinorhizobium saheli]|uniref:hypothetical protein n=1 Tax=Sinorhizobium saheli TaxID=36856 RepID=UPI0014289F9A|nr:hypothetical protein [Sinorhizobium saheli]
MIDEVVSKRYDHRSILPSGSRPQASLKAGSLRSRSNQWASRSRTWGTSLAYGVTISVPFSIFHPHTVELSEPDSPSQPFEVAGNS